MTPRAGFAIGATAAAAMLATLFVALLPARPPPAPPPAPELQAERAPKGDLLPAFDERFAALAPSPTIERTEAAAIPVPAGPALAPTHQRARQRVDICAAHGLRREYYQRKGWTYWRCR